MVSGVSVQVSTFWPSLATGLLFLASCCWLRVTESKMSEMNRGFGNLGAYNRKLSTTVQGQETSSQRPAASSQGPDT